MPASIILMKPSGAWQGYNSANLQTAISAAAVGDTITIYPGTYTGPFTLINGVNIFCLPGVTLTSADTNGTLQDNGQEVHIILSGEPTITNTGGGQPYYFTNANSKIDASNDFTDLTISGSLSISGSLLLPDISQTTGQTNHLVLDGNTIKYQVTPTAFITESGNKVYLTQPDYYFAVSNSYELTGSFDSDINQPNPPHKEGRMFWDSGSHTYAIYNDISDITVQLSQENLVRVYAGEDITNGNPVYISGSHEINPTVYRALADGTRTYKYQVVGIATHDIPQYTKGFITTTGRVNDIDLTGFNGGDGLWLSHLATGSYIGYPPPQPYERVLCGYCITGSSNGKMLVDIIALGEAVNTSVGIVDEPTFTDNGGGFFTVGASTVNLNSLSTGKGITKNYPLTASQFQLTSSLLDVHYVIASYNSGSPIYTLQTSRDAVDNIQSTVVATVTYGAGSSLSYRTWDAPGLLLANKLYDKDTHQTSISRASGLILGESGSRYVTVTEGHAWQGVNHVELPEINSAPTASGGLGSRVVQLVKSGSAWSGSVVSQYNNTQYNDSSTATGLANLGPNTYNINWLYRGIGNLNSTVIILSPTSYAKLADAVVAQPPETPSEFLEITFLLGRVIYLRNASTAAEIDTAFTQVFVPAGITEHNLLNGLQGGITDEYYHLSSHEYTGTGTGVFVRQIQPSVSRSLEIITQTTSSLIMKSQDGSRWNIWIDNNGHFSSSKI